MNTNLLHKTTVKFGLMAAALLISFSASMAENNIPLRQKYPKLFPEGKFGLQAHRGFSNELPENTLISFRQAAQYSIYKGMETDAQRTKDGVLVCMHDGTLDRTTNATGSVSDYTFEKLQEFWIDGGTGWDGLYNRMLKVPTMAEYLDVCKEYGLVPYVELKKLNNAGIKAVIELIHAKGFEDGTYVLTSFTKSYLKEASKWCDAPLEMMASTFTDEELASLAEIPNMVIRPQASKITQALVDKCHALGMMVECWSIPVGDAKLVEKLIKMGVEGGTCNSWKGLKLTKPLEQ